MSSSPRRRFSLTYVQGGQYLATCIRSVELTAVRAGMVRCVQDYPFCSHRTARGAGTIPWAEAGGSTDFIDLV
jgi:hypothetical protein